MFIIYFVVFLATASCQQIPPGVLEDLLNIFYNGIVAFQSCSNTQVLLSNINYTLYTKENQNGILLNSTNLNAVNSQNRVIFIIHGWLQSGTEAGTVEMKDTYLNQPAAANIIVVDWSYYSTALYGDSFCSVPQVGIFTGDLIYNLTNTVHIDLKNTQINGFSLGGQIAGYAGSQVQNRTGGTKIGRINGLDTAGPGFLGLPVNQRLDPSDALFVQGIHTSNWQFGYTPVYATADFQVNHAIMPGCGAKQGGCPLNPGIPKADIVDIRELLPYLFCNHVRAVTYFVESITSNSFIALKCDNCMKFGTNSCKSQPTIVMGENCPSTANGSYYLNINSKTPFAKGDTGI